MDKAKISATILLLITIAIVLSFNFDVTTVHDADQSILYVNESQTLSPTEQGITSSSLYALNNSYLEFDGVNDKVNTSFNINYSSGFTFNIWAKPINIIGTGQNDLIHSINTSGYPYAVIALRNQFSNPKYYFRMQLNSSGCDTTSGGTITESMLNNWWMITGVFNGTNLLLYENSNLIDSVLLGSSCQTLLLSQQSNLNKRIGLGGHAFSSAEFFNGFIDEVRVYNRSLEESEITEIYNSGRYKNLSLPSDGLVLYMPFEETNGTTIYDNSGNNNNGELIYE